MKIRAGLFVSLSIAVIGCGSNASDGPDADPGDCPTTGRYLPLSEGASWSYRVVTSSIGSKTQTVGALEDVGGMHAGTMAYKLTTTKSSGGTTTSWQQDTGTGVTRLAEHDNSGANTTEEEYVPPRNRIDESEAHVALDATWTDSYTEYVSENGGPVTTTAKTETWTVVAVDEFITVPAGTFCTLHLHRTSTAGGNPGSDKAYWFARGVGKIQEVSAGQTETLTDYSLP